MSLNSVSSAPNRRKILQWTSMIAAASGVAAVPRHSATATTRPSEKGSPVGGLRSGMIGLMLPTSNSVLPELVTLGSLGSRAEFFDLLANSDHFQPWQANEGHAGSAWVTMAALGGTSAQDLDGDDGDVSHNAI